MLVRMRRKENLYALLVGIQTGAATVEWNTVLRLLQKFKNRTTVEIPTSGCIYEET